MSAYNGDKTSTRQLCWSVRRYTLSIEQTAQSHLYILYFCLFEKMKKYDQGWVNFFQNDQGWVNFFQNYTLRTEGSLLHGF